MPPEGGAAVDVLYEFSRDLTLLRASFSGLYWELHEALYKEATAAMSNLREIFQKINQGQGSVGKLLNDESLYRNARLSLQKLDKATEGLEDQGPLSVLGIAINSLF